MGVLDIPPEYYLISDLPQKPVIAQFFHGQLVTVLGFYLVLRS
jgi:hypothetical protein